MKIGIYLNGLGQSVAQENALDYATRVSNELNKNDDDNEYRVKLEKIEYINGQKSNVVSILKGEIKNEEEFTETKIILLIYNYYSVH